MCYAFDYFYSNFYTKKQYPWFTSKNQSKPYYMRCISWTNALSDFIRFSVGHSCKRHHFSHRVQCVPSIKYAISLTAPRKRCFHLIIHRLSQGRRFSWYLYSVIVGSDGSATSKSVLILTWSWCWVVLVGNWYIYHGGQNDISLLFVRL